jgi:pimeloyl-ACP methyl ester carboxylesterase
MQYYLNLESHASAKATQECMSSFAYTDFTSDLDKINVPTLIIHGTSDKTVPIDATSVRAAKMIVNNTFIKYDGAPHGLFYTHKDKLNKDLIEFIKG